MVGRTNRGDARPVAAAFPHRSSETALTGHGMGGHGALYMANDFPERFAAVASVVGSIDSSMLDSLGHVPLWAFHGEEDTVLPLSEVQKLSRHCGPGERTHA